MTRKALKLRFSERGVYEPVLSEEDVLGQIRALLEANGVRVHRAIERIPWGKKTSEPGVPDLFGYISHCFMCPGGKGCLPMWIKIPFFIEVKRPGGKLRPAQQAWIDQAQADGVICFMADSVEKMVENFKGYGIEIKGLQK